MYKWNKDNVNIQYYNKYRNICQTDSCHLYSQMKPCTIHWPHLLLKKYVWSYFFRQKVTKRHHLPLHLPLRQLLLVQSELYWQTPFTLLAFYRWKWKWYKILPKMNLSIIYLLYLCIDYCDSCRSNSQTKVYSSRWPCLLFFYY